MKKIKNIVIAILAVSIIILGYFLFFGNKLPTIDTGLVTTDKFAKNQECLKYKKDIEAMWIQEALDKSLLEQIFYSPKQDSCLYVRYDELGLDKNLVHSYIRNLYDILSDGYVSDPLEQCIVIEPGENCTEFDKKLEEYKNPTR